jgi:hypothetical protein
LLEQCGETWKNFRFKKKKNLTNVLKKGEYSTKYYGFERQFATQINADKY